MWHHFVFALSDNLHVPYPPTLADVRFVPEILFNLRFATETSSLVNEFCFCPPVLAYVASSPFFYRRKIVLLCRLLQNIFFAVIYFTKSPLQC